jgi:hypothetical protein
MSLKRRLRIGFEYLVTSVWGHTDSDLDKQIVLIESQQDDDHLPGRILSINGKAHSGRYQGSHVNVQGTFRIHNPKPSINCTCMSYGWPHRLGSGSCVGLSSGPFCGTCGKPCTSRNLLSLCCKAPVYEDPSLDTLIGAS